MVLWGALHSSYTPDHTRMPSNALTSAPHPPHCGLCRVAIGQGSALLCGPVLSLVRDPPNPSLNLNPSEISEVIAWAKNKSAAGEGPSISTAEAFPRCGARALSCLLWPPVCSWNLDARRQSHWACLWRALHHEHSRTGSCLQPEILAALPCLGSKPFFPACLVLLVFLVSIPLVRALCLSGLLAIYC